MAQDYHELVVWQRAVRVHGLHCNRLELFRREELYGLISQMRRASVSVASNIAEERGRLNQGEFRISRNRIRVSIRSPNSAFGCEKTWTRKRRRPRRGGVRSAMKYPRCLDVHPESKNTRANKAKS